MEEYEETSDADDISNGEQPPKTNQTTDVNNFFTWGMKKHLLRGHQTI